MLLDQAVPLSVSKQRFQTKQCCKRLVAFATSTPPLQDCAFPDTQHMHAGRPAPTPTPRPTPTSTPLTCPCPTTPSTTPPAAPTISFTSTDSCPPEGAQASDSVTGAAVFFTAQVQFEEPVQGSLTPADFGVGSVAPPSLVSSSNSSANCSCGTAVRREPAPGMLLPVTCSVTADDH